MSRVVRVFGLCALIIITVLWFARDGATQSPDALSTQPKQARAEFVPGEVLVRFRSEAAAKGKSSPGFELLIEGYQIPMVVEDLKLGDTVEGLRLVRVKPEDTAKAIEALNLRSDVLYAEPNFVRKKFVTPNDPLFPTLWGLNNPGQDAFGEYQGFIRGDDIDAEQAWNLTTGSRNVVVGIVDGGIDINHPDLSANIWINPAEISGNGLDDDGNGVVDDINGFDFFHNRGNIYDATDFQGESHATHIAGTIGAVGSNSIGVVGVNWEVSLLSLKIFGRSDEDPQNGNVAIFVRAYAYAKKMRDLWVTSGGLKGANIRVLNASIGGYGYSRAELDALRSLDDSAILFVAAAGNYTRNNDVFPIYPAGYQVPNMISVAASGPSDGFAFFSNVGNESVTLTAPGQGIQSTTPNGTYGFMQGTSMAAPHVAGAAALICAKYPEITVKRLRAALIYNGDFVASQTGKSLTSRRLNALNSLNAVTENDHIAPAAIDLRIISQNGRSLVLGWTTPGDDGNVGKASIYEIRYSDHELSSTNDFEAATSIWPLALPLPLPAAAGTLDSATVEVPYLHTAGYIGLRATDNMGNTSPIAVVSVSVSDGLTNLYDVAESVPQPLTTGGTQVPGFGRNPDDGYALDYQLPFAFPYYGHQVRNVTVSTNGALYFSVPPKFLLPPMTGQGQSLDARNSLRALHTNRMIAGMWDDLVVTGVYAVTPDSNRIIFRWEGKTFDLLVKEGEPRGENPISFETELRADGTIQIRYGDGNKRLFPIVGISDGRPDAYVVNSHTSADALMDLTAANTVTFSPRLPRPQTSGDLQLVVGGMSVVNPVLSGGSTYTPLPGAVAPGEVLQFNVVVTALGPDASNDVVLTAQLPAGTSFVGCDFSGVTCSGPALGTDGGTVTANLGTLGQFYYARAKGFGLQVKVTAPPGTTLETRFAASSSVPDPNPINNNASATALVENYTAFNQVIAVDGSRSTIALRQDGTVWFWGLPYGVVESVDGVLLNPKQIDGLSNVIAIAAGAQHALALRADGTVWSWGVNERGQLGNQHIANSLTAFPPTMIPGLGHIRAIAAGRGASFAVDDQGLVWVWGDNTAGALGDGTTMTRTTPVQLQTISGVVKMATTGESTFAITGDGKLWSWGDNFFGQLGNGQTRSASLTPAPIDGLSRVRSVAADWIHTIALLDDGTVWTWGRGGSGELGNGTQNDSAVPILVPNLTDVTSVDAGASACLALKADGRIWFWGEGNGTPRLVDKLAGVKAIAAWNVQYAAIMADDSLQMWAYNSYIFQDGTMVQKPPAQINWLPVVLTPRISAESNTYIFPRDVSIDCETPGAVIHYTTNGNDPTESDAILNPGTTVRIDRSMTVKAKAWKPGLAPSKVASASYAILVEGAPTPPQLVLEESGQFPNQAAAVDSVMNLRDPFPVHSAFPVQGSDRNTRVTLFLRNLQFFPGEMPAFVIVNLIDANSGNYDVPAEDVRTAFGSDLTQVTFRIPDNLAAGPCTVRVMAHGQMSNAGTIRIKSVLIL